MIVLDVNAAYAMALGTDDGRALESLLLKGEKALAPALFIPEAANVAWKSVSLGESDPGNAAAWFDTAVALVDEFVPDAELAREALAESLRQSHPVYDMLYLVLARRAAATLFTLDRRLAEVCVRAGVNCVERMKIPASD